MQKRETKQYRNKNASHNIPSFAAIADFWCVPTANQPNRPVSEQSDSLDRILLLLQLDRISLVQSTQTASGVELRWARMTRGRISQGTQIN